MKAIKALIAVAAFAVALIAVHQLCWMDYVCDVEKNSVGRRLSRAFKEADPAELVAIGRAMLIRLRPCLERDPFDYQLLVTNGIAADAAGQKDLAMQMYRSALALNERPEILANMAELQFENGQPDEARRNLLRAASFHIAYVMKVSEPMRSELVEEVKARKERLLAAKQRSRDQAQVAPKRP
jgi:tetratricopeptide (TPR) repeat protein